jgi:desampylase
MEITKQAYNKIIQQASRFPSVEVTGAVANNTEHEDPLLQWVVPMQNVSRNPTTEYAWDPAEMKACWDNFDTLGFRPVAIYHSHPGGKPDPSETDMLNAYQVGFFYLIAYPKRVSLDLDSTVMPVQEWAISAWECISTGILVDADLVIV